ncbi:MAG: hypothetical protein IJ012_06865 [Clostridia bacterium]|nr:hypothetical protein [Clostridia bacterium]
MQITVRKSSFHSLSEKKKRLSQYQTLLREIQDDRLRLARLAGRLMRQNPAGLPIGEVEAHFSGYEQRIVENMARCERLAAEIQEFVNGIEDSMTRRVFTLRYLSGYTWQKIAFAVGAYDESVPRKRHDRYLKNEAALSLLPALVAKTGA